MEGTQEARQGAARVELVRRAGVRVRTVRSAPLDSACAAGIDAGRKRIIQPLLLMLGAAVLSLWSLWAGAAVEIQVEDWGIGGAVKGGMWCPLYLELVSRDEDFDGEVQVVVETGPSFDTVFSKKVVLIRDTPARHWLYFRFGASGKPGEKVTFSWRLVDEENRAVKRSGAANADLLPPWDSYVAVFRSQDAVESGVDTITHPNSAVKAETRFVSLARAPDRWMGYDAVDAVVWIRPDPTRLSDPSQITALTDYVRRGGELVIAGGAEDMPVLTKSFLSEMLPATVAGIETVPGIPTLSKFDVRDHSLSRMQLLRMEDVRGKGLLFFRRRPVVVRGAYGFGRVTLIPFDPTLEPVAGLRHKDAFWREYLEIEAKDVRRRETDDLHNVSTSLVGGLGRFPRLETVSFKRLKGFAVIYLIAVGPVAFVVLRFVKKLRWSWVALPCAALAGSVLAAGMVHAGYFTGTRSNSLSIVDADARSDFISGTTYTAFLLRKKGRYDVTLEDVSDGRIFVRGIGDSKRKKGGPSQGGEQGRSQCKVDPSGRRVSGLTMGIWDVATLEASWWATRPELPKVDLAYDGKRVTGSVTNGTTRTISRIVVLLDGSFHESWGSIKPGETHRYAPHEGRFSQVLRRGSLHTFANRSSALDLRASQSGRRRSSVERDTAVDRARGVSLFSQLAGGEHDGRFRRCVRAQYGGGLSNDLPRRLNVMDVDSKENAVVLLTVDRSFGKMRLSEEVRSSWDMTLLRLRVPVKFTPPEEK